MAMHSRTLALSGALLLVLAACGKGQEAGPGGPGGGMPPPQVGVVQAKSGSITMQQDLVGRLAAYRSADVRARVPGVLQKRVYEEGSDVREGQELFVIDPSQLRADLGQAQGSLAQAQANYANAKAAAERARRLLPQKYISQSDYDDALAAERTAGAQVQTSRAAVDNAQINLGYASVRAPIAGRAGKQQVTEGALVGQGATTLLTTVDQIDPLYVNFSMSVTELSQVRRLQGNTSSGKAEVDVELPDGSLYSHKGTLDFSGDTVDPATGAVALRATLPNPERTLLPGTYVTLKASLGSISSAFLIPQAAVQRDAQSAYVLTVGKDGMVARKDIDADRSQGTSWIVTKGVTDGDQIIVSGLQAVGMAQQMGGGKPVKVNATPWQSEGASGAPGAPGAAKPGAAAPGKNAEAAQQQKTGDAATKKD